MAPITAVQTYMAGCGNLTANVFGISYYDEVPPFGSSPSKYPDTRFSGSNQTDLQSSVAPTGCTEAPTVSTTVVMGVLTSTAVPNGPLTVTSGQIITITVTLSFS